MNGIVDVITLLLGLSGFGLAPNPRPPAPEAALAYAIADADIVVHIDAASVIPANHRRLTELASQPAIAASPELAKAVREAVTQVESARGLAKTVTGIDLATDVADVTGFVQLTGPGEPPMVFAAHGRFSAATIDKISAATKKPASHGKNGAAWVEFDATKSVAVTGDGVLLFGTTRLLADRTRPTWHPPPHGAGTSLGHAAELLAGKPVLAVMIAPSATGRDLLAAAAGAGFAKDLIARGKLATFALYHDGIGWSWIDSSKTGLDAMSSISSGAIDVLRGSQVSSRGFAKIVLGGLDSYRYRAEARAMLDAYTGDGTFKAKVSADPKTLRLDVRLTGRSVADVVPFGMILPLLAAAR